MTTISKPMLAQDAIEDKIKFPVILQTKTDGCRLLHITGKATGRSLKQYKNKYTSNLFSDEKYAWLDGEAYAGTDMYAQDLCRKTTSALNRIEGEPFVSWMVFDYLDTLMGEINKDVNECPHCHGVGAIVNKIGTNERDN